MSSKVQLAIDWRYLPYTKALMLTPIIYYYILLVFLPQCPIIQPSRRRERVESSRNAPSASSHGNPQNRSLFGYDLSPSLWVTFCVGTTTFHITFYKIQRHLFPRNVFFLLRFLSHFFPPSEFF